MRGGIEIFLLVPFSCSVRARIVGEVHIEGTELLRRPSFGWHVAEESGVVGGNNGHLHTGIGYICKAKAAIVLRVHAQIVLIGELLCVAGGLERGHHELILL